MQQALPGGAGGKEIPAASKLTDTMQKVLADAKKHLEAAQQRQKRHADNSRRLEQTYAVGDNVLLSTKNLTLKTPGTPKLLPRWVGPFKVLRNIDNVAYELELPASMKCHDVFHVSLLKPYFHNGQHQPAQPVLLEDGSVEYVVERILTHRDRHQGRKTVRDYLVQWQGYGPEHNSWEPTENLQNCRQLVDQYLQMIKGSEQQEKELPRPKRKRARMS